MDWRTATNSWQCTRNPRRPILTATVLTVLLLWLVGQVAHILLLLFLGVLISLYLRAVAAWFERRLHLPDRLAFAAALLLTVAGIVALFWILVPPVITQTQALIKVLPSYITDWEAGIERTVSRLPALQEIWKPGEHKILIAIYEQFSSGLADLTTVTTRVL